MSMRIAGIQISASSDPARTQARALEMAALAAEKGAKIICYPELFLLPWFPMREADAAFAYAAPATGGLFAPFQDLSRSTGAVLVLPFFEAAAGSYYNSAALIDGGAIVGVYRKVHLPNLPLYRERHYFSPGTDGFPVFETSRGRIGVQICWDNLFPEGTRILALKDADIVVAPTASSQGTHTLWSRAITANAFANNVFVFRVNRVGAEDGLSFYGRSFCADPWGEMASELAGSKEAIVMADVDFAERRAAAETWGFLKHRVPSAYGDIVKGEGGPGPGK